MEFVGEDLAALDAALAFLDEWDVENMEGGLGALYVDSKSSRDGGNAALTSALVKEARQEATVDQMQHAALRRMLEPEPFSADADANTINTRGQKSTDTTTIADTGAVADKAAEVKGERLSPPSLSSSTLSVLDAWGGTGTCAVEVDGKPRSKKKRSDDDSAITNNISSSVPQDPRALALQSVNLRVKRRRQKEELLELRQKVQQLETRLSQMKTNSPVESSVSTASGPVSQESVPTLLPGSSSNSSSHSQQGTLEKPRPVIQHRSPLGMVWERLAARQLKERERVEEENQRLKGMLDEHVKLARSLDRILRKRATSQRLNPDGMVISGRETTGETRHEDISRVNNLVTDLEGLYSDIDLICSRFGLTEQLQTPFRDTKLRKEDGGGSGVFLESMDSRVLPFDMKSTGATVWQFLAEESGGQARFYYQNCTNMTEDIRTCTYGIEMQHKETKAAFWGTSAIRKYVENGRIVISWAGQFEPVKTSEENTAAADSMCGFVFRHKGWVDITPSVLNPTEAVVMQSYYRIEPELEMSSSSDSSDPNEKISALMDFVISTTDARLDASHQFIENILMQQTFSRK